MDVAIINLGQAVLRRGRLRGTKEEPGVICSEWWIEQIVVPAGDGQWEYRRGVYPPGNGETSMINCPACGRICPPPSPGQSICRDCEVEKTQEWLSGRLAELSRRDPEMARQLGRLWWPRISYGRFAKGLSNSVVAYYGSEEDETEEDEEEEDMMEEEGETSDPSDDDKETPFDIQEWRESSGYDEPLKRREGRYAKGAAAVVAVDKSRGSLIDRIRSRGVAPGCSLRMLSEKEKDLMKEINHFTDEGEVYPSTQVRVANPYSESQQKNPWAYAEWSPVEARARKP